MSCSTNYYFSRFWSREEQKKPLLPKYHDDNCGPSAVSDVDNKKKPASKKKVTSVSAWEVVYYLGGLFIVVAPTVFNASSGCLRRYRFFIGVPEEMYKVFPHVVDSSDVGKHLYHDVPASDLPNTLHPRWFFPNKPSERNIEHYGYKIGTKDSLAYTVVKYDYIESEQQSSLIQLTLRNWTNHMKPYLESKVDEGKKGAKELIDLVTYVLFANDEAEDVDDQFDKIADSIKNIHKLVDEVEISGMFRFPDHVTYREQLDRGGKAHWSKDSVQTFCEEAKKKFNFIGAKPGRLPWTDLDHFIFQWLGNIFLSKDSDFFSRFYFLSDTRAVGFYVEPLPVVHYNPRYKTSSEIIIMEASDWYSANFKATVTEKRYRKGDKWE